LEAFFCERFAQRLRVPPTQLSTGAAVPDQCFLSSAAVFGNGRGVTRFGSGPLENEPRSGGTWRVRAPDFIW
jgi:hypothetical protein